MLGWHYLLLNAFWPPMRYLHTSHSAPDISTVAACPIAQPIPMQHTISTWDQSIADERARLEALDIFDLPEARHLLELDKSIEQHARHGVVATTKRYWDIACLLTTIARALQERSCADLVLLMARGSDSLRLEESRVEDEATQLQSFHAQVRTISAAVARDAQLAQQVQFSGENSPILIQQNVQAEDSLVQWTHLPDRLAPHFARTVEICNSAMSSTAEIAPPIHDLREHLDKMTQKLSMTAHTCGDCRETLAEVRRETFENVLRFWGVTTTSHHIHLYYSGLFGLADTSTPMTRQACTYWNAIHTRRAQ